MNMPGKQKLLIISLLIYWPVIYVLSHMPIPRLVYQAQVSDKAIHVLIYLILTFLLWFAVIGDKKVNWRKIAVWYVILLAAMYGATDEISQGMVGRSCDIADFTADMAGIFSGLFICTFFAFWPAFLIATGTCIFLVTNLAKANISELLPITNLIFHLASYTLFTTLWIRCINQYLSFKSGSLKWFLSAYGLPIVLLLLVQAASFIIGREFSERNVFASFAAITIVITINFLRGLLGKCSAVIGR